MKTDQWIIWHDQQEQGPLTGDDVRGMVSAGQLPRTALARHADDAGLNWKPLDKIIGLLPAPPMVPVVPPPPRPGNPYYTLAIICLPLWIFVGLVGVAVRDGSVLLCAGFLFVGIFFFLLLGEIRAVRVALHNGAR